jgi:hypothetical protein
VDTDSLFVNSEGLANLKSEINPTELGKLKIEKSGSCSIRGCKDYTFNGKIKLKGIKEKALIEIPREAIEHNLCIKLTDIVYLQDQFDTKHRRYSEGTPDGTVLVHSISKKLSRNYDKGIVARSGKVSPLIFSE